MNVSASCPGCSRAYLVRPEQVGSSFRCPNCGQTFVATPVAPTPTTESMALATTPPPLTTPSVPPSPGNPSPAGSATIDHSDKPRPGSVPAMPTRIGRFQIRARLGAGAFGVVYRAHDTVLKREVALKVPKADAMTRDETAGFIREAEAAAQLRHPNIVPVHDAGRDGDVTYIASAFISGRTLREALDARPPSFETSARWSMQLAAALAYAHEQKVVHRDVKPANVMVDARDEPHLMDFGLARWDLADQHRTLAGAPLGTPLYMSPEQTGTDDFGPIGPASDQYAVGVMLYEMLTGQRPFSGNFAELMQRIRTQEPASPRTVRREIPLELDVICLKAMSKRPADRYADCHALAEDLRRYLAGDPITARRLSLTERAVRWSKKNKTVASLLGTVAALLIIVAIGSTIGTARMATLRDNETTAKNEAVAQARLAEAAQAKEAEARRTAEANATLAAEKQREAVAQAKAAQDARAKESEARRTSEANATLATEKQREAQTNAKLADERKADADVSAKLARKQHYITQMKLAQSAWNDANIGRLREIVANFAPERNTGVERGFEWHYWDRLCKSRVVLPNTGEVLGIACSRDRKWIATRGRREITIWESNPWREKHRFQVPTAGEAYAFNSDGTQFVWAGSTKGVIKIWDLQDGREVKSHSIEVGSANPFLGIAMSPNARFLAVATQDSQVKVWNTETGKLIHTLNGRATPLGALSFTPDARFLAGSSGGNAIWDLTTGELISTPIFQRMSTKVNAVSAHGRLLANSESDGNDIVIHDVSTARIIATLSGHTGRVGHLAFSDDGKKIATGSEDNTVRVWDPISGGRLATLRGHAEGITGVSFSADGNQVVSSSPDGVQFHDLLNSDEERLLDPKQSKAAFAFAFSSDGKQLAAANRSSGIRILETEKFTSTVTIDQQAYDVAYRSDGRSLACVAPDNIVRMMDTRTREELKTFEGAGKRDASCRVSPDGRYVAIFSSGNNLIQVWDHDSGEVVLSVSASYAGTGPIAFGLGGLVVVGNTLKNGVKAGLSVWKIPDGQQILNRRFAAIYKNPFVYCVAISDDGKLLASGDAEGMIRVFDVETFNQLYSLQAHKMSVNDVSFSSDSGRLVSAGGDGFVKVWDAISGQEVLSFDEGASVRMARLSPNGKLLVSCRPDSDEGSIKVRDATPWPEPAK